MVLGLGKLFRFLLEVVGEFLGLECLFVILLGDWVIVDMVSDVVRN
jgi:hypothetical protein